MARNRLPAGDPDRKIVRNQRTEIPGSGAGPGTPIGELEQLRKFTSGLARQTGWRRLAARIGAVAILLLIVACVIAEIRASG
jgi:hypothetical protein